MKTEKTLLKVFQHYAVESAVLYKQLIRPNNYCFAWLKCSQDIFYV